MGSLSRAERSRHPRRTAGAVVRLLLLVVLVGGCRTTADPDQGQPLPSTPAPRQPPAGTSVDLRAAARRALVQAEPSRRAAATTPPARSFTLLASGDVL